TFWPIVSCEALCACMPPILGIDNPSDKVRCAPLLRVTEPAEIGSPMSYQVSVLVTVPLENEALLFVLPVAVMLLTSFRSPGGKSYCIAKSVAWLPPFSSATVFIVGDARLAISMAVRRVWLKII